MSDAEHDAPVLLDLTGLRCPLPALRTRKTLRGLPVGARLIVSATDPLAGLDIPNAARQEGAVIEDVERADETWRFRIRTGPPPQSRAHPTLSPPSSPKTRDIMAPTIRGTRTIHEGWSTLLVADLTMPDGSRLSREIEDHGRAACVLPYDPERRCALLIRQLRAPVFYADGTQDLLEAPAGIVDEGDASPEEAVRREAFEEAGIRLSRFEPVAATWSMPGISTERMHLFLAPYALADRTGAGGGLASEGESIAVVEMPLSDLAALSERGELVDQKTLLLTLALRLRHPELFRAA